MCFLTVLSGPSVLCSADFPMVTLPFPMSGAKQGVGSCMGIPTGPGSQRPMNRMVRIGDTHPDSCDYCAVTLDLGSGPCVRMEGQVVPGEPILGNEVAHNSQGGCGQCPSC